MCKHSISPYPLSVCSHPRKTPTPASESEWERTCPAGDRFQAAKDSGRYSSYQGPRSVPRTVPRSGCRNGLSAPPASSGSSVGGGYNARVLLEAQELLRLEQRRREQEMKGRGPSIRLDYESQDSKGPHRQEVPPSPSQVVRLSRIHTPEKTRPFLSWNEKGVPFLLFFKEAKCSQIQTFICVPVINRLPECLFFEVTLAPPNLTAHWCVQRQEAFWFAAKTFKLWQSAWHWPVPL